MKEFRQKISNKQRTSLKVAATSINQHAQSCDTGPSKAPAILLTH